MTSISLPGPATTAPVQAGALPKLSDPGKTVAGEASTADAFATFFQKISAEEIQASKPTAQLIASASIVTQVLPTAVKPVVTVVQATGIPIQHVKALTSDALPKVAPPAPPVPVANAVPQPASTDAAPKLSRAFVIQPLADSAPKQADPAISHAVSKSAAKGIKRPQELNHQKPEETAALIVTTPIPIPLEKDAPRALLLTWNGGQKPEDSSGDASGSQRMSQADHIAVVTGSNLQPAAAAIETAVAAQPVPQQNPIAFSVKLQAPVTTGKVSPQQPSHTAVPAAPVSAKPVNSKEPAASEKISPIDPKSLAGKHSDTRGKEEEPSARSENDTTPEAVRKLQESAPVRNVISNSSGPITATGNQEPVQTAYLSHAVNRPASGNSISAAERVMDPPPTHALKPNSIDIKVAGAQDTQVDVRVSQRAGDVQVTVRTPNGDLAQSLRQHLPELSDRLAQNGVHGDFWQPTAASSAGTDTGSSNSHSWNAEDSNAQQQQGNPDGRSNQGQQDNQQSAWLDELNQAEKERR